MTSKKAKIILCGDQLKNVKDFAQSSVKSAEIVDALSVMQTEYVPEENTIQVNQEGSFFVANLTDAEAKKMANSPEVEEIIDDEKVYAFEEAPPYPPEVGFEIDDDIEGLELNSEDIEELESNPFPELLDDEEQMTPAQLNVLSQYEPAIDEEIIEHEHRLIEGIFENATDRVNKTGLDKKRLIKIIRCIINCVQEGKNSTEELDLSDHEIKAILHTYGVQEENVQSTRDLILWSIRSIYADRAWRYSTGSGVRVAVVDSGIQPNHFDLRVSGGVSYVPGRRSWVDDNGHGTHVAGTIAASWNRHGVVGVAPYARLYSVKVLDRNGRGSLSSVLNGLMWCYRSGMHIVNLSLGSAERSHSTRIYNRAYEHVGQKLRSRGILAVAAAGNDYHRPVGNPARCPSFMAVSAIDAKRRLARFSNIGPQVEVCAPGVNIISTYPTSTYRTLSGTSMACPHVAGAAALVKARRSYWHGDKIRVHLWRTALDLGNRGRDWAYGYGQVNALRAVL